MTINLIGTGNLAFHLYRFIIKNKDFVLQNWYGRTMPNELLTSKTYCSTIEKLKPADLTIIAVSDDAIVSVSSLLIFDNQLVVHTSGTKSIQELNSKNRRGVFYPLQSFSKNKAVDFLKIPICIETENEKDKEFLKKFASIFSENVNYMSSNQRLALHISAVFANNFSNLMYQNAYKICQENHIDFNILKPLILETANKINTITPIEAQTGPAKRKDLETLKTHQDFLKNSEFYELYVKLTAEILKLK